MEFITVNKVSKKFDTQKRQSALENISFEVKEGEFVCIVGPSGCGKSTLLRIIAGLMSPTEGNTKFREWIKVAMVFQNFALFPWLTVEENIAFGLKMTETDENKIAQIVTEQIGQMGLGKVRSSHPKELSGGMKQRVGIARALAISPNLLLLDEPFSSLDIFTANKLRQELLEIWKEKKLTVLMVSHLIEEATQLSDRIIVLSSAPGKIKKIVGVILDRPRNQRSDGFYKIVDEIQAAITE